MRSSDFITGKAVETGALTCGTKCVTSGKLPHAREELTETADKQRHADHDVGDGDAVGIDVDQRQDECRRREGEEPAVEAISQLYPGRIGGRFGATRARFGRAGQGAGVAVS